MIDPKSIKLTKDVLENISINEIIYAEAAGAGAMGNSGGIMFYILRGEELICYETNLYKDEETYLETEKIIDSADRVIFDFYYGGMGNRVYVNKNVSLKKGDGFFILHKNGKEYKVYSSVKGVYISVASALLDSENK